MPDPIRLAARRFAKEYWAKALPRYAERFDSADGDGESTLLVADAAFRWWLDRAPEPSQDQKR